MKGHFQDIEFWKHAIDFMDLQFNGTYSDPYETYIYEAEESTSRSGCSIARSKIHAYGSYIESFNQSGDYIEWNNVSPGAGTHYIAIRAACSSMTDLREIDVIVNGITYANHHGLGCWTDRQWFMDYRVKADFHSGNNTIRFVKQDPGELYIDRIVIYTYDSGTGTYE
jgi:hypothetical protein